MRNRSSRGGSLSNSRSGARGISRSNSRGGSHSTSRSGSRGVSRSGSRGIARSAFKGKSSSFKSKSSFKGKSSRGNTSQSKRTPQSGGSSQSGSKSSTFKDNSSHSGTKPKRGTKEQAFYTKQDIFLSRMASILRVPKGTIKNMFSERTFSTIRINDLAGSPSEIVRILNRKGIDLTEIPWSPNSYFVTNRDKSELGTLHEYEKGLFYIQNLSSMLPVVVLNPKPGEKILDLCAAPGSKTTQIASFMKNQGEIIANDDNAWRSEKLRDVLEQFNVKNTQVTINKGENIGDVFVETFDRVLLDAPCSGEGLIYLAGQKPLRFWSIKKSKTMVFLQRALIDSAWKSLKNGGTLVYSTCTLEPAENEGIVNYLLQKRRDARLEEIEIVRSSEFKDFKKNIRSGITSWNEFTFPDELRKTVRVAPSAEMMGFFVAKLRKV